MKNGLTSSIRSWLTSMTAIVIFGLFIIPITLILSLKWFNPPISSSMLGYQISDNQNQINYEWKDWDEIAESAPLAVIAAEEQLFTKTSGFNLQKIKQVLHNFQQGSQGNNTDSITRQTAKNLFLWPNQSSLGKGLETWLTLLMETSLDEQRILELYLNVVEFSPGVYGIEAASQHFFYKPASNLTSDESALLAAVLTDPKHFRADSPSAFVEQRQRKIISQMNTLDLCHAQYIC